MRKIYIAAIVAMLTPFCCGAAAAQGYGSGYSTNPMNSTTSSANSKGSSNSGAPPADCSPGTYQVKDNKGNPACIKTNAASNPPCGPGTYQATYFSGNGACIKADSKGTPPCGTGTYQAKDYAGNTTCIKP